MGDDRVFLRGKTVYDDSGRVYEFHHEHDGKAYCYPILEFQDGSGETFDIPGENLVALNAVHLNPPVRKLSEDVKTYKNKIDDLKVQEAELRGAMHALRSQNDGERRMLEKFMEEGGILNRIGKLMAGEDVVILEIPGHEWYAPIVGGVREVQAIKLLYDQTKKAWRFAKARGGSMDGNTTLVLFDSVEEANAFVSTLFAILCGKVKVKSQHRPSEVYNPDTSYTTPHISKLREWQEKWPHLVLPQEILESEQAYLKARREAEVASAIARVKELTKE